MVVIRTAALSIDNCNEIVRLWNRNFGEQYRITENMFMERVFKDKDFFPGGSFLLFLAGELKGFIISKINSNGLPGYEDCAWISCMVTDSSMQGKGYGKALYQMAEAALLKTGIKKIILGGECCNFFSGIPQPTAHSIGLFEKQGYTVNREEYEHYGLMADVSAIDFDIYNTAVNCDARYYSKALEGSETQQLDGFFKECFPGRWDFEVMGFLKHGGAPENVIVLMQEDEIVGFSKIDISGSEDDLLIYGPSRGSLGPIGVSEAVRGKGLGKKILLDSLKILKQRGARNVIIDWTVLKDFYGQFGFKPWRTYRGAYKQF